MIADFNLLYATHAAGRRYIISVGGGKGEDEGRAWRGRHQADRHLRLWEDILGAAGGGARPVYAGSCCPTPARTVREQDATGCAWIHYLTIFFSFIIHACLFFCH